MRSFASRIGTWGFVAAALVASAGSVIDGALRMTTAVAEESGTVTTASLDLVAQEGSRVTFRARLAGPADEAIAAKKLQLVEGTRVLATVKTDAAGEILRTVKLKTGVRSVVARFRGDAAHATSTSAPVAVTIAKPVQTAPANRASVDTLRPRLTWNPVDGATSYRVRLQTPPAAAVEIETAATSLSASGVRPGGRSRWSVVAVLDTGTSLRSATRSFKVRTDAGSGWVVATIDAEGETGYYPDVAVDTSGRPHIVYRDADTELFRLAEQDETGAWTFADLGTSRGPYTTGRRSSIAIDDQDRVHVVWHQADTGYIYTRRDAGVAAVGPGALGGGLAYAYLGYVSIDVDRPSGTPFVAMQRAGVYPAVDVSLGGWFGSGSVTIVEQGDDTDWAGRYCSVACGADARPRVAYQLEDSALSPGTRLEYAVWNGASWDRETAATDLTSTASSGNNWENGVSLAVDGQNRPRIVYIDGLGKYRFADRDSGTWAYRDLAETVYSSFGCASVAVSPDGDTHVAMMAPSDNLTHAVRRGAAWTFEQVDTVGLYPSLAIDADGGLHIAYHDDLDGDLKYAYRAP